METGAVNSKEYGDKIVSCELPPVYTGSVLLQMNTTKNIDMAVAPEEEYFSLAYRKITNFCIVSDQISETGNGNHF